MGCYYTCYLCIGCTFWKADLAGMIGTAPHTGSPSPFVSKAENGGRNPEPSGTATHTDPVAAIPHNRLTQS